MICSGVKKEEYRNITDYWTKRLFNKDGSLKQFDVIEFRNGYGLNVPSARFEYKGVEVKKPNAGWCPSQWVESEFYAIKIGKQIKD